MTTLLALVVAALLFGGLAYHGRVWLGWLLGSGLLVAFWGTRSGGIVWGIALVLWLTVTIATGVPAVRRRAISAFALNKLAPMFPKMSETERVALEAGTTWWDAELFSGEPDWDRITKFTPLELTADEKAFLDGPCTQLCRMLDDHAIRAMNDLPKPVWDVIKRDRFMGMIIPQEFGGLGFSARAHSSVVAMLASRSAAAAVTVMVPNSLGPAELLLRYGTDAQKQYYLPRLAVGDEVPCFALTEPHAGSDAAGIRSTGVVCRGTWDGREVLGIRLDWDKRYITLAPIATVLGLAFQLHDPDQLLGGDVELGITCALIPTTAKGVWIGRRHDPMSVPFQNGPTRGHSVFVPIDHIIGGPAMAGHGWRMLMECLSAGRSLSLPADAVGGAQLAMRVTSGYAAIREQFGLPIAKFEGIAMPMGRMAGTLYWMNALRVVTAGAVDAGEKPSVISSVAKCWTTEALRRIANDAMDIAGGAGICKGAHNTLSAIYESAPIGITVEGANILTRSLIVFGQGAIRCHPWALQEMHAVATKDVHAFDHALAGHVGFAIGNMVRAFSLNLTGGRLASVPVSGAPAHVLRQLSRLSSAFAVITDVAMATMGGGLKRAEAIAGRMADALAWMYIASATVNRRVAARQADAETGDDPLFDWATTEAIHQAGTALDGVLANLPNRIAAALTRLIVFPFGVRTPPPSDTLTMAAARAAVLTSARSTLTRDMFVPPSGELGLGRLEHAVELAMAVEPLRDKLRTAIRDQRLPHAPDSTLVDDAVSRHVITAEEAAQLRDAFEAMDEATRVDDFAPAKQIQARAQLPKPQPQRITLH